jgi:predicted glycosyltransferase
MMPAKDRSRIIRYSESRPRLRVIEFLHQPIPLLKRADRVVAMGRVFSDMELSSFLTGLQEEVVRFVV